MDAGPTPSITQSKHDRYALAHAVLISTATFVTVPAAVLAGRYLRKYSWWNNVHLALNLLTVALLIASFVCANIAVGGGEYLGDADMHHMLGLAVFVIVLVTAVGGLAARFATQTPRFNYVTINKERSWLRYLHIFLGIASAALLYAQLYTGFDEWNTTSESMTTVPTAVIIVFWVVFGIEVALYLLGWPLMETKGRKMRARELNSELDSPHALMGERNYTTGPMA